MKRRLTSAFLIFTVLVLMLFGGSVCRAPDYPEPGSFPTRSPSMSAMPPEPSASPEAGAGPSPTPSAQPESYTVSFIGDITPDSVAAYRSSPQGYQSVVTPDNLGYVFEKTVQYFEDDDFTLANFECVLSNYDVAEDKNFTFRAPPEYAGLLTEGGVDFVTLGNNHAGDFGQQGYEDTKAALDSAGVAYAGRDEYALYETDSGLVIGVYALSFGSAEQIRAGVSALEEAGAEFIIAALHWGDEGSYDVNSTQLEQGRAAIDAGADVVYGSHPHTLQPVEYYNGHYIFYSMGNWSFGGNTNPPDRDTAIARLTLERGADGGVAVTGLELIPCACSGDADGNNYQPVPYAEGSEEYARTLSKLDGSFTGANLTISYEYGFNEY